MVLVLELLYLHLTVSEFPDGFCAGIVVACVHVPVLSHTSEQHSLLIAHLFIHGEESRGLLGCQSGLGSNELLKIGLEAFRVELLAFLCARKGCTQEKD